MDLNEIKELNSKYLFQNYGRMDIALTHGKGAYLYDTEGKEYLDLVSGIAVNSIGYAHPEWVKAMEDQISKLIHVSNLYYTAEQAELGEKLASVMPGDLQRSLFVNSGAEANEGAMKLAVRYTKRSKIISALNGFHGRTSASLGATGQTKYQESFEPLISNAFRYYEYDNIESVKSMIDKDTAALLVEPIQGEGGVVKAKKEFFKGVRDLCTDHGVLMVVDEVQTGIGRTGKWFGIEESGVVPDVITMAKGLGGGVPIGAITTTLEISKVMTPGTHGTTFGGNPLVSRSACAVIDIIKKEKLVENAGKVGKAWMKDLKGVGSPKIKDVRGSGFIIGVELNSNETASQLQRSMLKKGFIVNICHGHVLRLIPPLILTSRQKDDFMSAFNEVI
ncbi:glutamate-1-semialdehyde 2,1-aminomutase [Candidatus Methanoplasma termitum]|uniref:HemL1 protein n=1 Tax=Candidatus Methanoplasma termitum TaxID=1577791 RepID=A0A0A7LFF3_9ARCH|nr:acetylornithine transaminase [Candidatus Methanoplasma termitum]AIZ56221.1 glutamate-1-semialdehyde 2,1-aminomutase [Candidatus Methanoplasma termitum]MCL2334391.1 acetylornithine transaminase [Candidatus Methanoplasma sp.]